MSATYVPGTGNPLKISSDLVYDAKNIRNTLTYQITDLYRCIDSEAVQRTANDAALLAYLSQNTTILAAAVTSEKDQREANDAALLSYLGQNVSALTANLTSSNTAITTFINNANNSMRTYVNGTVNAKGEEIYLYTQNALETLATNLGNRIQAEAGTRGDADTALDNRIDITRTWLSDNSSRITTLSSDHVTSRTWLSDNSARLTTVNTYLTQNASALTNLQNNHSETRAWLSENAARLSGLVSDHVTTRSWVMSNAALLTPIAARVLPRDFVDLVPPITRTIAQGLGRTVWKVPGTTLNLLNYIAQQGDSDPRIVDTWFEGVKTSGTKAYDDVVTSLPTSLSGDEVHELYGTLTFTSPSNGETPWAHLEFAISGNQAQGQSLVTQIFIEDHGQYAEWLRRVRLIYPGLVFSRPGWDAPIVVNGVSYVRYFHGYDMGWAFQGTGVSLPSELLTHLVVNRSSPRKFLLRFTAGSKTAVPGPISMKYYIRAEKDTSTLLGNPPPNQPENALFSSFGPSWELARNDATNGNVTAALSGSVLQTRAPLLQGIAIANLSVTDTLYAGKIVTSQATGSLSLTDGTNNTSLSATGLVTTGTVQAQTLLGSLAASFITGQLVDSQLSSIAASKVSGVLLDAQIESLEASKLTGTVVNEQLDFNLAANKISGALANATITAGSVTGIVSDQQLGFSIAAPKISGALVNATIATTALSGLVQDEQIAALSASKIVGTIPSTQVSGGQWGNGVAGIFYSSGNVGIGTAALSALLHVHQATATAPLHLRLGGHEYYQPGTSNDRAGLVLTVGVSRADNKQLWILDGARTGKSAANTAIRFMPVSAGGVIDAIRTDGTTTAPLQLGGSSITLNAPVQMNSGGTLAGNYTIVNGGETRFQNVATGTSTYVYVSPSTTGGYGRLGAWSSAGARSLSINEFGGNVGVGLSNPGTPLHVSGTTRLQQEGESVQLVGSTNCYLAWYPQGTGSSRGGYMGFTAPNDQNLRVVNERNGSIDIVCPNGGTIDLKTASWNTRLRVESTGAVQVFSDLQARWKCTYGFYGFNNAPSGASVQNHFFCREGGYSNRTPFVGQAQWAINFNEFAPGGSADNFAGEMTIVAKNRALDSTSRIAFARVTLIKRWGGNTTIFERYNMRLPAGEQWSYTMNGNSFWLNTDGRMTDVWWRFEGYH
jgi:hypothetical protein